MKAIVYTRYGPPEVLHLTDVATPTLKDNEVLIGIHAAAATTTDVNLRGGDKLMRLVFGLRRPRRPILGTEFAGEIAATGKDVRRFRTGDLVFAATGAGFGAYAEYICLPEDGALAPKPTNATYEEAAAICEGGLTALPFLRDTGKIQPGQKVLINGASGAVGNAAVQLARAFGADVTGVCGPTSVELVRSLGADRSDLRHHLRCGRQGLILTLQRLAHGRRGLSGNGAIAGAVRARAEYGKVRRQESTDCGHRIAVASRKGQRSLLPQRADGDGKAQTSPRSMLCHGSGCRGAPACRNRAQKGTRRHHDGP
jgi:threonine dehydrogenase-like Zn-dependent dehydrogenase